MSTRALWLTGTTAALTLLATALVLLDAAPPALADEPVLDLRGTLVPASGAAEGADAPRREAPSRTHAASARAGAERAEAERAGAERADAGRDHAHRALDEHGQPVRAAARLPVEGVASCAGTPLPGVPVALLVADADGAEWVWERQRTDARGRFAFSVPAAAALDGVRLSAWGLTDPSRGSLSPVLHPPADAVRFEVSAARLTLRLLDWAGRPLLGQRVCLHLPGWDAPRYSVHTDQDGRADFGWVAAGPWELRTRPAPAEAPPGRRPEAAQVPRRLLLVSGQDRDDVVLVEPWRAPPTEPPWRR